MTSRHLEWVVAADRRIVEVGGSGGSHLTTQFSFDGHNNLIEQVTDVGNVITDVYDGANRLFMESDSIGAEPLLF